MKCMNEALEHVRLRAPREDGGKLVDPPLSAIGEIVEHNVAVRAAYDYDVQGVPLLRLAEQARSELVEAAWQYTRTYRDVPESARRGSRLFLAGHQPQLFHPGVWFKNFVLSQLARRHDGVAINLAIDSDTIKSASLRVPSGTPHDPRVELIPFDRQTAEIPYEERAIVDRDCLAAFGERAAEAIRPLVSDPLVREFWPLVVARSRACDKLGESIAQARHQQEGAVGRRDARSAAEPRLLAAGVPLVHLSLAGRAAAIVGSLQPLGGRLSPRQSRPQHGASRARPGRRGRLAGSAVLDLGCRAIRAVGGCSSASAATRSCSPTGSRSKRPWRCRPRGTPPGRPSSWRNWPPRASGCGRGR